MRLYRALADIKSMLYVVIQIGFYYFALYFNTDLKWTSGTPDAKNDQSKSSTQETLGFITTLSTTSG